MIAGLTLPDIVDGIMIGLGIGVFIGIEIAAWGRKK